MNELNRNQDSLIESIVLTAIKPRSLILFTIIFATVLVSYQLIRPTLDPGIVTIYSDLKSRKLDYVSRLQDFVNKKGAYYIESTDLENYENLLTANIDCDLEIAECIDENFGTRAQIVGDRLKMSFIIADFIDNDEDAICKAFNNHVYGILGNIDQQFLGQLSSKIRYEMADRLRAEYNKLFYNHIFYKGLSPSQYDFSAYEIFKKIEMIPTIELFQPLSSRIFSISKCVVEKKVNTSNFSYSIMIFVFFVFLAVLLLIKVEFDNAETQ